MCSGFTLRSNTHCIRHAVHRKRMLCACIHLNRKTKHKLPMYGIRNIRTERESTVHVRTSFRPAHKFLSPTYSKTITVEKKMKFLSQLAILNFLIAAFIGVASCQEYCSFTITINRSDDTCSLDYYSRITSCATLMKALQLWPVTTTQQCSSTHMTYQIPPGDHEINGSFIQFKLPINSVFLSGNDSSIKCTESDTGFFFEGVSVELIDITFSNCSSLLRPLSTLRQVSPNTNLHSSLYPPLYVALYVNAPGYDITMNNVSVHSRAGVASVVIYNTDTVNIKDCLFITHESYANDTTTIEGYGGLIIELDSFSHESTAPQPHYEITRSTFINNTAITYSSKSIAHTNDGIIPSGANYTSFGKGGGLTILLKGSSNLNNIEISDCEFSNNEAVTGGGLFVSFLDNSYQNTITVRNSKFSENKCPLEWEKSSGGGGISIEHFSKSSSIPGNTVNLLQTSLIENSAHLGGGVAITLLDSQVQVSNTLVSLSGTTFLKNSAVFGSALHTHQLVSSQTSSEPSIRITNNCVFDSNSIEYRTECSHTGIGALHSKLNSILFDGTIMFCNNKGSALTMIAAYANFTSTCSASFVNNTGTRGGAIALLGAAFIQISKGTEMTFENNAALYKGGAIFNQYTDNDGSMRHANCFIKHTDSSLNAMDWGVTFTFRGNKVLNGNCNNAIHSTSILPCESETNMERAFCWKGWIYDDEQEGTCLDHITTDFKAVQCSNSLTAIPGLPFNIPLSLKDELNNSISEEGIQSYVVMAENTPTDHVTISPNKHILITGNIDENINVSFESLGDQSLHIKMKVGLKTCPPGFIFNANQTCTCPENDDHYEGYIKCDSNVASIIGSTWIGQIENDTEDCLETSCYFIGTCPMHYCNPLTHEFQMLPKTSSLNDVICKKYRQGVLCGECIKGYGTALNTWTYECVECNETYLGSNVMRYLASVYIPCAALLLFVLIFNIKLTLGSMNAFILFSQMIVTNFDLTSHGSIPLAEPAETVANAYRFIYAIFNFDFIEKLSSPICLSQKLNMLSVLLFNYLLVSVCIIFVIITVLCNELSKKCLSKHERDRRLIGPLNQCSIFKRFPKSTAETFILLLSTIILLSYSKLGITSSQILNIDHLISSTGNETVSARVHFAGQLTSTSAEFIRYAAVAIIGEVFIVFFMLVMFDYPLRFVEYLIHKVKVLSKIYPEKNIHAFTDTFQNCFKESFRWFSGLYFLFRYSIGKLFVSNNTALTKYVGQELACIFMIILLVLFWPYKQKILNYVDMMIFSNLAIINALNCYQYTIVRLTPLKYAFPSVFGIQFCLVIVPVICLLLYLIFWSTKKHHTAIKKHCHQTIAGLLGKWSPQLCERYTSAITSVSGDKEDSFSEVRTTKQSTKRMHAYHHRDAASERASLLQKRASLYQDDGRMVRSERGSDVPVTVVNVLDKDMGEASTYQTSGHFLRTEWNAGAASYGSVDYNVDS